VEAIAAAAGVAGAAWAGIVSVLPTAAEIAATSRWRSRVPWSALSGGGGAAAPDMRTVTVKIDERIEPLVREALAAAVKSDAERFLHALEAFPDDAAVTHGVHLAMASASYVLLDMHNGRPTDAELREIAAEIQAEESWAEVAAHDLFILLSAALDGRSDNQLPIEKVVALPFVAAAYLLAAGHNKGEWWFDYFDRVEAALERE
jgi:hypothetical protein